jgi:hypothetical protein
MDRRTDTTKQQTGCEREVCMAENENKIKCKCDMNELLSIDNTRMEQMHLAYANP